MHRYATKHLFTPLSHSFETFDAVSVFGLRFANPGNEERVKDGLLFTHLERNEKRIESIRDRDTVVNHESFVLELRIGVIRRLGFYRETMKSLSFRENEGPRPFSTHFPRRVN